MESTHRQLCSWLTNRLSGDNTDSFTEFGKHTGSEVQAVALLTATTISFAGKSGADLEALESEFLDLVRFLLTDELANLKDDFVGDGVCDFFTGNTTVDTGGKRCRFLVVFDNRLGSDTIDGATVSFKDDHVLGNVHQLTGHVTRVRGLKRSIGKSLTGTVSGDEVFQYGKTFTEVRSNRAFDNVTGRLSHQTTHTGKLLNLLLVTTSTGVDHEEQRVDEFVTFVVLKHTVEGVSDIIGSVCPDIDHLLVTFVVSNNTVTILFSDFLDISVGFLKLGSFFLGNYHVDNTNRDTGTSSFLETKTLELVENQNSAGLTCTLVTAPDNVANLTFTNVEVDETKTGRPDLVETNTTWSGHDDLRF